MPVAPVLLWLPAAPLTYEITSLGVEPRVERANKTLQDRLVKELRLHGISSMEGANAFAEGFLFDFNARFAKPPKSEHDAHRKLRKSHRLEEILCIHEERKLTKNLTFQYKNTLYALNANGNNALVSLQQKRIQVLEMQDGSILLKYGRRKLSYRAISSQDRKPKSGSVVANKELDMKLGETKKTQASKEPSGSQVPSRLSHLLPSLADIANLPTLADISNKQEKPDISNKQKSGHF